MTYSKTAAIRSANTVIAALFLAGCVTGDHEVKRTAGAGLGGVAGGVHESTAGSGKPGIAATVEGTLGVAATAVQCRTRSGHPAMWYMVRDNFRVNGRK